MSIHNVPTLPKLCDCGEQAADMLRQQHSEIERLREMLAGDHEEPWAENRRLRRYVGNNMLMSDFRNVDEMRAEIKRLTACLFTMQNAAMALTAERDTAIAAAVAAEREARAAEIDRLKRERHHIYDLLARIHRDGGQYTAEHGVEKACEDAESQVVTWLDTISGVDALIEQARIAERAANSMLIASAPDLLEVCRRLSHVSLFAVDDDVASIIMLALDTVQKATGEKP